MTLEDNGSVLTISYKVGEVDILKEDIAEVRVNNSAEKVVLAIVSKANRAIKFEDVTSPVFSEFSDFKDWIKDSTRTSRSVIEIIADADDAADSSVDVSAYSISSITSLFQNNAFIPSSDYTLDSGIIEFDVVIEEGDIISIYE